MAWGRGMARIRQIDRAGRLLDLGAVPRWLMRSILLGIGLYFFGASIGTVLWYLDRPWVLVTFVLPQVPAVVLVALVAMAVMRPSRWWAKPALAALLLLPAAWLVSGAHVLVERLPAGPAWIAPAVFRLAFLAWLGLELWHSVFAMLSARREDAALADEPRLWPALLGAPPALREITAGRRGAALRFGVAMFLFAFAVLQAMALNISPDVTWQGAIARCGSPAAATTACFTENSAGELFGQLIVWPLGFFGAMWAARRFERWARGRTRQSAAQAMAANDVTPPILFLRAFKNDQVRLRAAAPSPMRWLIGRTRTEHFLDHMLVEEFAAYGPTVALGRPQHDAPAFGVWRTYLHDATEKEWQNEVARLADRARLIVMVADEGEGVAWELQHLGRAGHLGKTIVLAPPELADPVANARLWSRVASQAGLPFDPGSVAGDQPVLGVFHEPDGAPCIATSSRFTANDYLATLRWCIRTEHRPSNLRH